MNVSDKPGTLRAQMKHHEPIVCFEPKSMKDENWGERYIKNALRAEASKSSHAICYAVKTKQIDMRTAEDTAHPLDSNDDKEPQAVCFQQNQREEVRSLGEQAGALTAQSGMHNTNYVVYGADSHETPHGECYENRRSIGGGTQLSDPVYAIEGHVVDRNTRNNGKGWCENVSPTLNTQDRHAVVYAIDCRNNELNTEVSGTLQAHTKGGWSVNCTNPVMYEAKNE